MRRGKTQPGCEQRMNGNEPDDHSYDWLGTEDDDGDDSLSVWDAADIWLSSCKDEDYMFGYTEEELENAL